MTNLSATLIDGSVTTHGHADAALRDAVVAVLAIMRDGDARLTDHSFELHGIASTDSGFQSALRSLRAELPAHISTQVDVYVIETDGDVSSSCAQMFAAAVMPPVHFDESGVVMRSASMASLDRLVDFADDCEASTFELVGHSDASGPESLNIELSLKRAQATADYLSERGVDGDRLVVRAAGSTEPIADNATRLGREQNRRVEVRLQP